MFVYRRGKMNAMEEQDYQLMKRSPYRNYVSGELSPEDQIAFLRVIDSPEKIAELEQKIEPQLPENIRMDKRIQPGMNYSSGLYFFHKNATIENQKEYLIQDFKKKGELGVVPIDMLPKNNRYSDRDAIYLLNKLQDIYEPYR